MTAASKNLIQRNTGRADHATDSRFTSRNSAWGRFTTGLQLVATGFLLLAETGCSPYQLAHRTLQSELAEYPRVTDGRQANNIYGVRPSPSGSSWNKKVQASRIRTTTPAASFRGLLTMFTRAAPPRHRLFRRGNTGEPAIATNAGDKQFKIGTTVSSTVPAWPSREGLSRSCRCSLVGLYARRIDSPGRPCQPSQLADRHTRRHSGFRPGRIFMRRIIRSSGHRPWPDPGQSLPLPTESGGPAPTRQTAPDVAAPDAEPTTPQDVPADADMPETDVPMDFPRTSRSTPNGCRRAASLPELPRETANDLPPPPPWRQSPAPAALVSATNGEYDPFAGTAFARVAQALAVQDDKDGRPTAAVSQPTPTPARPITAAAKSANAVESATPTNMVTPNGFKLELPANSGPQNTDAKTTPTIQPLSFWTPESTGPAASGSTLTQQPMIRSEGVSAAAQARGWLGRGQLGHIVAQRSSERQIDIRAPPAEPQTPLLAAAKTARQTPRTPPTDGKPSRRRKRALSGRPRPNNDGLISGSCPAKPRRGEVDT